jgi:hypothetical protein
MKEMSEQEQFLQALNGLNGQKCTRIQCRNGVGSLAILDFETSPDKILRIWLDCDWSLYSGKVNTKKRKELENIENSVVKEITYLENLNINIEFNNGYSIDISVTEKSNGYSLYCGNIVYDVDPGGRVFIDSIGDEKN